MYEQANQKLWQGRCDVEDKEDGKRWHEKIQFLNPCATKDKAGLALFGFASDEGVRRNKGRIGSASSPDKLKKALGNFAYHLENIILYDAGSVIGDRDLEKSQEQLALYIDSLLEKGHFPLILGGGHEIAFGSFMGLHDYLKEEGDIAIINFDAHFDLRKSDIASSGTPFLQIAKLCEKEKKAFSYMCLGVSKPSNTKALFKTAQNLGVSYIEDTKMNETRLKKIKKSIDIFLENKKNLYITIDLDVFKNLPAVSAPAARGISFELVSELLEYLFKKHNSKIKLLDLAEFNPDYDEDGMNAKLVARLIFDIVSFVDKYKKIG